MFSKVISLQGFWKSVFSLGIAFIVVFVIVKWAIEGLKMEYFTSIQNPINTILGLLLCGFVYGFLVTFGKFKAKLKKEEVQ